MSEEPELAEAPYHALPVAAPKVIVTRRADGTILLRHPKPLGPYAPDLLTFLERWGHERADATFLAQRGANGEWQRISYGQMLAEARAIGQGLLARGLAQGDRITILSGNSLNHARIILGAMMAGIATSSISPPYALMSRDFAKLRSIHDKLAPRAVFVEDVAPFAKALEALALPAEKGVIAANGADMWPGAIALDTLLKTAPGPEIDAARKAITPDTIARIFFTSGSTGWPKGVIKTHRMLCSNLATGEGIWTRDPDKPRRATTWLPWSHTMAGNVMFNDTMVCGGTYFLDGGRPASAETYAETLRNLAEVQPDFLPDVPLGLTRLADALEADPELAKAVLKNIRHIIYAGAAMPDELWRRIQKISIAATGHKLVVMTGFGSTEAGPQFLQVWWPSEGAGYAGLPMPGPIAKLVPIGDQRYEIRVKGDSVTQGYYGDPEATKAAFDDEGFYRMGDALRFVDEADPGKGLRFAGRLAEDFKLLSGTFVSAGALRTALVGALSPIVSDVVITGDDRTEIGALVWLSPSQAAQAAGLASDLPMRDLATSDRVRKLIADRVAAYNAGVGGSSLTVRRVLILTAPPSVDANEMTDKGYVNRRRVLDLRSADIDRLYDDAVPEVIRVGIRTSGAA